MTDTKKGKVTLPWSQPSVDGSPNPAHRMHQEVAEDRDGNDALGQLRLSADAYAAFNQFRRDEVTPEFHDQLAALISKTAQGVVNDLGEWPLPPDLNREQDGDTLYIPYLAHVIWTLLGVLAAQSLPDATHAERYAWAAELVRVWASYGIFTSAVNAGIDVPKIGRLAATRCVGAPMSLGAIAQLHITREEVRKEAERRGVDPAEIVAGRVDELKASLAKSGVQVTDGKVSSKLRGEPDDDIAF